MVLTDTHCHIHEARYEDAEGAWSRAHQHHVGRMICVGTDVTTSGEATVFAETHDSTWASVGLHPHEAAGGLGEVEKLRVLVQNDKDAHLGKIVAIGECGLDYFYEHSPREAQIKAFEAQMQLGLDAGLPMIFHVREAFDDFWPIYENFSGVRGVLHSFTDSKKNLEAALSHGLYVGVNGISTFTKSPDQQAMFASIPLSNLLLETDSPFLTPIPYRGKVNEPAFITHVAQHIANLQAINLEELSRATERNATQLFFSN